MYRLTKNIRLLTALITLVLLALTVFFITGADENKIAANAESTEKITLPIIMYHSLLSDKNMQNVYTVSPQLFEGDLKYIVKNGYTTITVSDLKAYVYSATPLPPKCIMLTFDDGCYNNFYYAYPLLKKYNCKAVFSPIASACESYTKSGEISVTYGSLNSDNIKELSSSGYVEIQNHSYDMHRLTSRRGIEQKKGESLQLYKTALTEDVLKAQSYLKNCTGKTPDCFVYPFGAKSDSSLEIIKELGFVCTMTCAEKTNRVTKNPDSLFELGRYLRKPDESIQSLFKRMNKD